MFAKLVGEYLLTFGNIELTLENTIETIIKKVVKGNEEELKKITRFLLKGQSASKKLDTLKFLIKYIDLNKQQNWLDFIGSVKKLSETRNILAHGMYGVEDDKFLKMTYDNNVDLKETVISLGDFQLSLEELGERYRQLFDSMIGIWELYISKYPKLEL